MTTRTVALIDPFHRELAIARVALEGNHLAGTIDLHDTPDNLRALFDEFEEIVNGQMFSFLDEIQKKIAAVGIRGVWENAQEVEIKDLQVYPSTGDVSFRLTEEGRQIYENLDKECNAEQVLSELELTQQQHEGKRE